MNEAGTVGRGSDAHFLLFYVKDYSLGGTLNSLVNGLP